MGKQSAAFLSGEGAAWLQRNVKKLRNRDDPVITGIADLGLKPKVVLEVGCANGWRLRRIHDRWKSVIFGIDPCIKDIDPIWMDKGTADDLRIHPNERFDLVIYGFCLYVCDREDLFKIASEGDRVLKPGGYIVIYDFYSDKPYCRPYEHRAGVFSYKMDHANIWLSHPSYVSVCRKIYGERDNTTSVTILLKKSHADTWPIHDD